MTHSIAYILFEIIFFLLGASVASFICNVSYRLQHNELFVKNRSKCDTCDHLLSWLDLVPIFGWISLQGKCRYCQTSIPQKYFITEIFLGFLYSLSFHQFWILAEETSGLELLQSLAFLWFLCWSIGLFAFIALYDLDTMLILDSVILPGIAATFLFRLGLPHPDLIGAVMTACGSAFFIWSIVKITKGNGMGRGDIKLAFLIGLTAGWPFGFMALLLGFVFGALIGLALVLNKRKNLKDAIPFGPFLALGTIVSLLYGQQIWDWYLNTFIIL